MGDLYQWFTDIYAHLSLQELKNLLNDNINSIYTMIDSLSEEELFKPHMRKWADEATKTAVWEMSQKVNENFVVGYTFNLCKNYIFIVILNQNIKNQ